MVSRHEIGTPMQMGWYSILSYSRPSLMIIVSRTQFHVYLQWGQVVVAAFNQEKALVWAFSVIVQLHRLIVYTALVWSQYVR